MKTNDADPFDTQYDGPPQPDLDDPSVSREQFITRLGGTIKFSVDGCNVPISLRRLFSTQLFINPNATPPQTSTNPLSQIFYEGCKAHDFCYQTCGSSQSACDNALRSDIENACRQIPPNLPGNGFHVDVNAGLPDYPLSLREECLRSAGDVYLGLAGFGFIAHANRQKQMCVACKK